MLESTFACSCHNFLHKLYQMPKLLILVLKSVATLWLFLNFNQAMMTFYAFKKESNDDPQLLAVATELLQPHGDVLKSSKLQRDKYFVNYTSHDQKKGYESL